MTLFSAVFVTLSLQFVVRDAGYTPTDWVLDVLLANERCRWVSVTNADNVYGSDIVNRVLRVGPIPITRKLPDMVLNPLDSRYFAHAGTPSTHFSSTVLPCPPPLLTCCCRKL